MKKYLHISLAVITASLLFVSCKKDDPTKTSMDLLTQRSWKIVADEERVGTSGNWTDYFSSYSACEKDDETVFRTNSTYEINEGITKCDPSDPQVYQSGTWTFNSTNTVINLDGVPANVDQLDENTLILSSSDNYNGVTTYYRYRFSH
jgi:hypothetical protein